MRITKRTHRTDTFLMVVMVVMFASIPLGFVLWGGFLLIGSFCAGIFFGVAYCAYRISRPYKEKRKWKIKMNYKRWKRRGKILKLLKALDEYYVLITDPRDKKDVVQMTVTLRSHHESHRYKTDREKYT